MATDTQLALVFPGQGSQSVGMLNIFPSTHPIMDDLLTRANSVLGYDIGKLIAEGPDSELNKTDKTQPAMLIAGVIAWKFYHKYGNPMPAYFAGHSLGEYTALVCAGVLTFEDGLRLVLARAQAMQQASAGREGAMAAILGLPSSILETLCESVQTSLGGGQIVAVANLNSPKQTVISGDEAAVVKATEAAREAGARRVVILPVSVPSHCVLMQPAADSLKEVLATLQFSNAQIPIIQNVDAIPRQDAGQFVDHLLMQLFKPVQWTKTIETLCKYGISKVVECGPGKVLCGLNKQIATELNIASVFDERLFDE